MPSPMDPKDPLLASMVTKMFEAVIAQTVAAAVKALRDKAPRIAMQMDANPAFAAAVEDMISIGASFGVEAGMNLSPKRSL